ncbi:MAG: UvrD-helicase domain-containing protein [Acidobacteriota bacterium]|jgi:ATP-dependent exoDNAse (exonuclease V) beta subunit|nr:UvrD-helicase domain-containing protein [Acidobacteriota bacterium]
MGEDRNFTVYRASAGSGKTYTLAREYIKRLLVGDPRTAHRHILAVTFTNDAAGEMKERILGYLRQLAADDDKDFLAGLREGLPDGLRNDDGKIRRRAAQAFHAILHDYSNFHVTTIDSFFQSVVRNLARELGVGSRFDIELDTALPVRDAVKAVISEATAGSEVLGKLARFVNHKLEDDKWSVERDLQSFSRFIFNETFQKKARALNQEFTDQPDKVANARDECVRIIKGFESGIRGRVEAFDLMDHFPCPMPIRQKARTVIKDVSKDIGGFFKKLSDGEYCEEKLLTATMRQVYETLSGGTHGDDYLALFLDTEKYRRDNLPLRNSAKQLMKFVYQLELLKHVADKIEAHDKEQNRFVLANTNQLLGGLVGKDDSSFVFEKIGAQIRHVVIDEFQDTSELQWKNFKVLISEILATNSFGMLVGDVKQSIYRWRNGDWRILNDIENELGDRAGCRSLDANYRSAREIVEFNNALFEGSANDLQKDARQPFAKAYVDVRQKQRRECQGYVSVDFVEAEKDGRNTVKRYSEVVVGRLAEKIKLLLDGGVRQGDICILCRKNKQIRQIADELPKVFAERYPDAGESVKIISESAYRLGGSKAVRLLVAALRLVNEPRNPALAAELYLGWKNGDPAELSRGAIDGVLADIEARKTRSLPEWVEELCRKFFAPADGGADLRAGEDVLAFMDKLTDYLSRNTPDIGRFLEHWDEKLSKETLPLPVKGVRDGILAMSIHQSKGLQFHTVIVPFADWPMAEKSGAFKQQVVWCEAAQKRHPFDFTLLPLEYNSQMECSLFAPEYAEETDNLKMDNLNLLYVALTRAEKNLLVLAKEPGKDSTSLNIQDLIRAHMKMKTAPYATGYIERHDEAPAEERREIEVAFNPTKAATAIYPSAEARIFASGGGEDAMRGIKEGNLVHRIFANIAGAEDIEQAVAASVGKAFAAGELGEAERRPYAEAVLRHIAGSGRRDWFSDKYKVFTEAAIIMEDGRENRPDRVLVDGEGNVVVLDYKTGKEEGAHARQVGKYMELLGKMGMYNTIKGYVWYLADAPGEADRIQEVRRGQ